MSSVTPVRVFGPEGVGVAVDPARDATFAICASGITSTEFVLPEQALTSHSVADLATPDQPVALLRHAVDHATASDHGAIQRLLTSVFHAPSPAEFQAELDQPLYDCTDRLLVRQGSQIVSHVHAMSRLMDFESLRIPVGVVAQLATLPEHRGRGLASSVLQAAEDQLAEDGAVLAMTWTDDVGYLRRRGWTVCGRHCYSVVSPRDLLAELEVRRDRQRPRAFREKPPQTTVRLWWHFERPALLRLHKERFVPRVGAFHRNDEQWQWLVARRAFDRIFVAIDGPLGEAMEDATDRIVGYAIVRGDRVVELVTSPDQSQALPALLRRIGSDAIERDDYTLRIDAPPDDPVHAVIAAAGGEHFHCEAERGVAGMVKLLDPQRFLTQLCPALHERSKAADMPRPFQLGLRIGGEEYHLAFSRRSVKLVAGKLGPDFLSMRLGPLAQMLLGHAGVSDLAAAGRIGVSSRKAHELARSLFPRLPMWLPPWDDVPAD